MSKQDKFKFTADIKADTEVNTDILSIVSSIIDNSDRVKSKLMKRGKELIIKIKAKDLNVLRSVLDNYLNVIKVIKEVDRL